MRSPASSGSARLSTTASGIDAAVRGLIDSAYQRARAILEANPALLRRGAKKLLDRETLTGAELKSFAAEIVKPANMVPQSFAALASAAA